MAEMSMSFSKGLKSLIASRRRWVIPPVLAIVAAGAAAVAQQKSAAPADVTAQVAHLGQQLWGVPLDESGPLTGQIEKLVLDYMSQWLAAHPPDAQPVPGETTYVLKVRREIENVFAGLHSPVYAYGNTFVQPYKGGQLLAAGYTLGWSDFDRANVIALYELHGGTVQQVALTHFLPDVDVRFHFFNPPPSAAGQFWFMIYGTRLGKSSPRLSAGLYSFDGKTLRSLWTIKDVYDGRVTFPLVGGRVLLSYLKEDELTQAIASNSQVARHEAAYHVAPDGMDLEYDR